ncbi:hypothetical protein CK503_00215 [Aliifodinibius salipaludis]|uniref:Uncharacterized protein n=2 Tax=Fodinibius salipaludis TaxID=2032627 RepID=A0A2A2GEV4_9BACT|nr:hypothetical protein CK503_00215 [Aliifodinibius salipaludis]
MKKVGISILIIIFCFLNGNAQELIDLPIAPRVDTTDVEVKKVYKLWQKHLSNQPNNIYDNPYWSEQQKEKWSDYDISRRWTYGYELSNGMNVHSAFGLKPRVLSIEKKTNSMLSKHYTLPKISINPRKFILSNEYTPAKKMENGDCLVFFPT